MSAFTVSPVECTITYACKENTGPRTDLCTVNQNAGLTASVMNTSTGDFEFYTTELDAFQPGTYIVTITATSGTLNVDTTFTLTLVDPCPSATLSINTLIFSGTFTYYLRDPLQSYNWVESQVATISGVDPQVDCGAYDVVFFEDDGFETPLDSIVF